MLDYRFVYILKKGFRYKIGIAKDTQKRVKNIRKTSGANNIKVYAQVRTPFAMRLEQWLHSVYKHKQRDFKGSGKTEWFDLNFTDRHFILFLFWLIACCKLLIMLSFVFAIVILFIIF